MPRTWHDIHAIMQIPDEDERDIYRRVIAEKKPYFMRYIYPALMKEYNTYIKNTEKNALREFQMTVDEIIAIPVEKRTERQAEFLKYYHRRMPVGMGDCVMNTICRKFEAAFDGYIGKHNTIAKFDYRIMRSDAEYTPKQFYLIKSLRNEYIKRLSSYAIFSDYERVDEYDSMVTLAMINDEFNRECGKICPDTASLCNIILDLCYTKSATKKFAWDMCGDEIIYNLFQSNDWQISYPVRSDDGDFEYCGERYIVETHKIGVTE